MIWSSFRHITETEILTWVVFLLGGAIFGNLGAQFRPSRGADVLGLLLWIGVFLAIYRLRYKRL